MKNLKACTKRLLACALCVCLTVPAMAAAPMGDPAAQTPEVPLGEKLSAVAPSVDAAETPQVPTAAPEDALETPEVPDPDAAPAEDPQAAPEEPPADLLTTGDWVTVPGIEGGQIRFDSSTGTLTDCESSVTVADIPTEINGVAVTSIGDGVFSGCSSLTRLTIPQGVTSFGKHTFYNCSSLAHVTIPSSVTSMNWGTFKGCPKLTTAGPIGSGCSMEFGWTVEIPGCAFQYCDSLTDITIPEGVTAIGNSAFSSCSNLTHITIPASVASMNWGAFSYCPKLTTAGPTGSGCNIEFGWTEKIPDCAFQNCGELTDITIPEGITSISSYAFSDCANLCAISIPASVTSMEWNAFRNCPKLATAGPTGSGCNIEFGWTEKIPDYAFEYCTSLTDITIPESVTSIGRQAFDGCSGLTAIAIPEGVVSIGDSAFQNCSGLTAVSIPASVSSIGDGVFSGCSSLTVLDVAPDNPNYYFENGALFGKAPVTLVCLLPGNAATSYAVPDGVTAIASGAFSGYTTLTHITIPSSVTSMGWNAFRNCPKLTTAGPIGSGCSIEFGWTEKIPDYAFENCASLTRITIPDGVTSIGQRAFFNCSGLTDVIIPDTVTSIGRNAFFYCENLCGVTIPGSVTSIGIGVFSGCSSLTVLDVAPDNPNYYFENGALFGKAPVTLVCLLPGNAATSYAVPDGVTAIASGAFSGCTTLTHITIPASVTSMEWGAFQSCPKLTTAGPIGSGYNIEFGWTEKIPDYAFEYCTSLTDITIPKNVTSIGQQAFDGCSSLTAIAIPEGVASIGDSAFQDCSGLTAVSIPASVSSIGDGVFSGCSGLTELDVAPDNPNYYFENGALFGKAPTTLICLLPGNAGTSYTVPDGVTAIGQGAFSGCADLTHITIPAGVTSMGWGAFQNCSKLTTAGPIGSVCSIEFGWTEKIPDYAFSNCSNLNRITIPESVTSIGEQAFDGCSSLTAVSIPASITSIAGGVFSSCSQLTELNVAPGNPNYYVENGALFGKAPATLVCLLPGKAGTSYTVPDGVTAIGRYAFYNCATLTHITIPASVTSMERSAFQRCPKLTTAGPIGSGCSIEFGWTEIIPGYSFQNCDSLTSITIPEGVTSIGPQALFNCSGLAAITIPDSVTSIGAYAFRDCSALTGLTIPKNVSSIGNGAFYDCSNLARLELAPGNPYFYLQDDVLFGRSPAKLIYYSPRKTETTYAVPDGITAISSCAFANCRNLTHVTIPQGVTSIGWRMFANCPNLTSVTIPDTVTTIGEYAFQDCTGLTSITIPGSVTAVDTPFQGCTSLQQILYNGTAAQLAAMRGSEQLGYIDYDRSAPVYCNMTETAVSFDGNGGGGNMGSTVMTEIGTGLSTLPDCTFTPPVHMYFQAWRVNGAEHQPGDRLSLSAGTVITAVWTSVPTFAVSFRANGGTGTMSNITVFEGDACTLPACAFGVPTDKRFLVWNINGKAYQPGDPFTPTADTVVTAIWGDIQLSCAPLSNDTFQLNLSPEQFSGPGAMLLATYSADGHMRDLRVVTIPEMAGGHKSTATVQTVPGGTYKLFLLEGGTYAPLLDAIWGNTVTPMT